MLHCTVVTVTALICCTFIQANEWLATRQPPPAWSWIPQRMTVIYRSIPVAPQWSQNSNAKEERENFNKNRVLSFMKELFGDKDVNAIDKYVAEKYVQHNPTVRDGKGAFKAAAAEWFAGAPKESLDIRRVAADDDMVWVHWRAVEGNDTQAVVDIFRVDKGMIAEHWDVIQTVPRKSMNSNSLF